MTRLYEDLSEAASLAVYSNQNSRKEIVKYFFHSCFIFMH